MKSSHLLVIILLLAAALRLYGLTAESLWLDEGYTARRAGEPLPELVSEFRHETQSGLYYVGLNLWCVIFGRSEFALRLPSVIFGVAATWAMFLLARRLFAVTAGLYAALLMAVNPFALYYSQDARPYMLLLAASTFSLYFLLRLLRRLDKGDIAGYLFFTAIALYTHPLAPLLLLVHGAGWLIFRRAEGYEAARQRPTAVLVAMLLAFVLFLPQLAFMWNTILHKVEGTSRAGWIPVPTARAFLQTARQYFMHPALAGLAFVLIAAGSAIFARRDRASRRGLLFGITVIIGCVVAPWVISRVLTPVYVDRYTIPALAGVILLLAWSVTKLSIRWRAGVVAVYLLLSGYTLYHYYAGLDKDPWRETARYVEQIARPGDVVVLGTPYTKDVFNYYYGRAEEIPLVPLRQDSALTTIDSAARIILVEGYDMRQKAEQEALIERITASRTRSDSRRMDMFKAHNPWKYWMAELRVTTYQK